MSKRIVTFAEIILHLAPNGYCRFFQDDQPQATFGGDSFCSFGWGVCGGFTTFSAFSVETAGLLQSGKTGLAMLYTALSLLLGVTVVLLGQRLVR